MNKKLFFLFFFSLMLVSAKTPVYADSDSGDISSFMVVDCLLPGQVRRLGSMTYIAARKAVRTTTRDCEIRGGEYVAFDRATRASSLKVWLPLAKEGDVEAQINVGEIFEKGMGAKPDYGSAAAWYLKAAEQGSARAAINLGNLFEKGLGLKKDHAMATYWFQQASGISGLQSPEIIDEQDDGIQDSEILLIEPPVKTRGGQYFLKTPVTGKGFLVVGQISSDTDVNMVMVDGQEAQLLGGKLFRIQLPPDSNRKTLEILALFDDGNQQKMTVNLTDRVPSGDHKNVDIKELLPDQTASVKPAKGKQFALVIGNNRYPQLPNLDTAVNDAKAIADILKNRYGFEVTLITNANRYQSLSAINDLRESLGENDRLLIYYAGHGELDRINQRGHWLPTDAEAENHANWISNITITDLLNTLPAQQIIVVADSCYSGTMSRTALGVINETAPADLRKQLLQSLYDTKTRTVLTSGGIAPVLDGGGKNHSVFARSLLEVLEANQGTLTGYELFKAVRTLVQQRAEAVGFSQKPEYAPLKFAGHEAGDFLFSSLSR